MLVADMILASSQMGHGTAELAKDKENKVLSSPLCRRGFARFIKKLF